jgi:hypothetical protein
MPFVGTFHSWFKSYKIFTLLSSASRSFWNKTLLGIFKISTHTKKLNLKKSNHILHANLEWSSELQQFLKLGMAMPNRMNTTLIYPLLLDVDTNFKMQVNGIPTEACTSLSPYSSSKWRATLRGVEFISPEPFLSLSGRSLHKLQYDLCPIHLEREKNWCHIVTSQFLGK